MKYKPELGFFGNLERAFAELTDTNRNVFNTQSSVQTIQEHQTEQDEETAALQEQLTQADDTAIELYEMQLAQEEINAAQDDALIEIYEMIGG